MNDQELIEELRREAEFAEIRGDYIADTLKQAADRLERLTTPPKVPELLPCDRGL